MMKIFFFILTSIATFVYSQEGIITTDTSVIKSKKIAWEPDRYVWSHMQNKKELNNRSTIDFNAIDNWQGLGDYLSLCPNGKYFAYTIERGIGLSSYHKRVDSLIVQSTTDSWRYSFASGKPGFFTGDSRQYIYHDKESLFFLQLGGNLFRCVKNVLSYKVPANNGNEWFAYQLKGGVGNLVLQSNIMGKEIHFKGVLDYSFDKSGEWLVCQISSNNSYTESKYLLLYNLTNRIEKQFQFVADYLFSRDAKTLILKIIKKTEQKTIKAIQYVNLQEGTVKTIYSAKEENIELSDMNMDDYGKQVVFTVQQKSGSDENNWSTKNEIWYYKDGMDNAIFKVSNETAGINFGLQIASEISFTNNGNYVQFSLQPRKSSHSKDSLAVNLDVWNYKDLVLQSRQTYLRTKSIIFKAIFDLKNDRVIPLESEDKTLYLLQGDFAIVKKHSNATHGDRFWEEGYGYSEDSNWVVSLKDASQYLLKTKGGNDALWFSPSGKYLIYFDPNNSCHYFSYNLLTKKLTDISKNISAKQLVYLDPHLRTKERPRQPLGLAAWLESDLGVLVYDNNDIWQLDISGKKSAINLTNGFGVSNNIIFSLMNSQRGAGPVPILNKKESLLLRAFSTSDKYNGYYRKILGISGDPELLDMGQYFMEVIPWCHDLNLSNKGMHPIKARNVSIWIVQRQSAIESPNYFKTSNFKIFERLTNYQPEKKYNWLSEELHSFPHLDGKKGQGILYKPENFDSTKKYPVLIIFYGAYSNNFHQFSVPAFNNDAITPGTSPNWYLNNGYLIFTPDIYVAPLKYGPEAFNVIDGAAKYLKQLTYVDSNKLGCCAHSWSAKLGSYLFTHSKSFSAMAISEGFLYANMIDVSLSIDDNGKSQLESVEKGFQFGNIWENRDSWLDQTTVLNVDRAISPLLLLCNKKSTQEYQNQTLQLFIALRRLEKKVWWLKYDKGEHNLYNLSEQKDYTIRYTQFFDHYLKDAPAPSWMTQGIPYKLKSVESRYGLDPAGSCAKDCRICKKWNEQYKKHPEMFSKIISEWYLN
jgi:dipeptidyl aminopeptidase/acylaminoacyl peptidase